MLVVADALVVDTVKWRFSSARLAAVMSFRVIAALSNWPSFFWNSMRPSTNLSMLSLSNFFKLLEAASTESAIIRYGVLLWSWVLGLDTKISILIYLNAFLLRPFHWLFFRKNLDRASAVVGLDELNDVETAPCCAPCTNQCLSARD